MQEKRQHTAPTQSGPLVGSICDRTLLPHIAGKASATTNHHISLTRTTALDRRGLPVNSSRCVWSAPGRPRDDVAWRPTSVSLAPLFGSAAPLRYLAALALAECPMLICWRAAHASIFHSRGGHQ